MATRNSPFNILSPLLLLAISITSPVAISEISYSSHCAGEVPESITFSNSSFSSYQFLYLTGGYFSGGGSLFDASSSTAASPPSFSFQARYVRRTSTEGVSKVNGALTFRTTSIASRGRNLRESRLHRFRPRLPRTLYIHGQANFKVDGFWDEHSGKLCMVGTGKAHSPEGNLLDLTAVVKLNYTRRSNITHSLVSGSVESVDANNSPNYFETIFVLAYSQQHYVYMPKPVVEKSCSKPEVKEDRLGFKDGNYSCYYLSSLSRETFELEYDCDKGICGPFDRIQGGFAPSYMFLNQIQCSDGGKVHMFIGFSNSSRLTYRMPIVPDKSLVAEGFWNKDMSKLCLVACYINVTDSLVNARVGDCSVRLSLWFPALLTLRKRSTIVGQLWSDREGKGMSYFNATSFASLYSQRNIIPGVKYYYTTSDLVKRSCAPVYDAKKAGKRYPDGKSVGDMRFDIIVVDSNRTSAWGVATPLSIGEVVYGDSNAYFMNFASIPMSAPTLQQTNDSLLNVSYRLSYAVMNTSDARGQIVISAEGVYNARSGILCMVGCLQQSLPNLRKQQKTMDSMDCEIQIYIQLAPLNSDAGEHLKGKIKSTRDRSHPLYFAPLDIFSFGIYRTQAVETISRMDIEIIMVVVSLTLSCIFIGIQLFCVGKNPDVLPSISITMLVILALGHMIPLVLNFEALFFMNRNRQNVLTWSGGWLEVNEVVVRVLTMVAFLLQFRFLQMAWSARYANEHKQAFWFAEKKTLRLCLPVYFIGGIIAWFVHLRLYRNQAQRPGFGAGHNHSVWEDLISYAGLILDGFLLPQVILNIFTNSKARALNPVFYIGTTAVRAMPHLYDAYRAHHYVPYFSSSYIYASPYGDLYSSAWDIIIPLEGVLFAVFIFLQQRFGGSCILPSRFRKTGGYEMVSPNMDSLNRASGIELN